MFLKWFPWRYMVRSVAHRRGFIDPVQVLAQMQDFAQPAEVAAPTELLRLGVVLHARGLMNSLAIQHNLDWVWPYWAECQYDPLNRSFIPRSFTLTQINLTHRNWTAIGIPGSGKYPIVDPRGLVTPFYDGWSLDAWILSDQGAFLAPSRLEHMAQRMDMTDNISIVSEGHNEYCRLHTKARVVGSPDMPICEIHLSGESKNAGWMVLALRPYNPEGVSFIHHINLLETNLGWRVNQKQFVYFDVPAEKTAFSYYRQGDVFNHLHTACDHQTYCKVGMSTASALYRIAPGSARHLTVRVPLTDFSMTAESIKIAVGLANQNWQHSLEGCSRLDIPHAHYKYLYEAALRTMILHSPKDVYPGPFVYRRFWFRDAAYILYALLCAGLHGRVKKAVDCFADRQTLDGYFLSQEGEWDSNGEALWLLKQYCDLTNTAPPAQWRRMISKGAWWIIRKCVPSNDPVAHAGLLPAGFSAEHLGPNDYYYWDDFWAVAGLKAASDLMTAYADDAAASAFHSHAKRLTEIIDESLHKVAVRLGRLAVPASLYRRLDTGAIATTVASYPLQLWSSKDPRLLDTVNFLMEHCLVNGGFFHDMTHSGINPYLTLHLAQTLLRAGDERCDGLMETVANLASPTGQWPEAIHPQTKGGCMGDGQHVWAAAEWCMMVRNCFIREEGQRLVLGSGIPPAWLQQPKPLMFGPAPTRFGIMEIQMKPEGDTVIAQWQARWFREPPEIMIRLRGYAPLVVSGAQHMATVHKKEDL